MDFFGAGGHFGRAAAVDDVCVFRAEPQCGADGVHGRIAAADHGDAPAAAVVDRRVEVLRVPGAHQVDAGEKLVGRVDAPQVFAGDVHEPGEAGAGGDEDGVEAFLAEQFVDRHRLADDDVGLEFDPHAAEVVDFALDDFFGEAELGDAIDEHAADLVQRLEDGDGVALLDEVAGAAQPGRSAADDGDLLSRNRSARRQADLAGAAFVVGHETFNVADRQWGEALGEDAGPFALVFLRADASGDGGEDVVFAELGGRLQELPLTDEVHDLADLDADRTAVDAFGVDAREAALRFALGKCGVKSEVDLVEVVGALVRVLLRHRLPGDSCALLGWKGFDHAN
jgi:hypothetical protein